MTFSDEATSLGVVRAVDEAIAACLVQDQSAYPVIKVDETTAAVMATLMLPPEQHPTVLRAVCDRTVQHGYAVLFGELHTH
jgi:hypothetical protein